ncbi:hypothetical protein DM860_018129 [Cuscuta australis]|uniref:Uncharacterized protein n=1 Tax=Cuscuta australis TaxID=267555 RepID=A0A328DS60_9ASTE|nr:hypothetical protein DM860_018129 [Cuscuta australis]
MASTSGTKPDWGSGRLSRAPTMVESATGEERVPSSLQFIVPLLRVANEIERENETAAFICRLVALDKANKEDPKSTGRGVRQLKTYLQRRLEGMVYPYCSTICLSFYASSYVSYMCIFYNILSFQMTFSFKLI